MPDRLTDVFVITGSALKAQNTRMKIIAENMANANSAHVNPGDKPYQRQVVTFKSEYDRAIGAHKIKVAGVVADRSDFIRKFDPSNPAADAKGYVTMPNVNSTTEMMDMNEASQAYQANLNVIDAARSMVLRTIQILQ